MRVIRYCWLVVRRATADTRQFLREHLVAESLVVLAVLIVNLSNTGTDRTLDSVILSFAALVVFVSLVFLGNLALAPARLARPPAAEVTELHPIGVPSHTVLQDTVILQLFVDPQYLEDSNSLHTVICTVTSPSGSSSTYRCAISSGLMAMPKATYPADFYAPPLESGQYRVVWSGFPLALSLHDSSTDVTDWFAVPPRSEMAGLSF